MAKMLNFTNTVNSSCYSFPTSMCSTVVALVKNNKAFGLCKLKQVGVYLHVKLEERSNYK